MQGCRNPNHARLLSETTERSGMPHMPCKCMSQGVSAARGFAGTLFTQHRCALSLGVDTSNAPLCPLLHAPGQQNRSQRAWAATKYTTGLLLHVSCRSNHTPRRPLISRS